MRILFVTQSIPFPPRNGRELPNAHIIDALAQRYEVDLLSLVGQNGDDFSLRKKNVPATVRRVDQLTVGRTSPRRLLLDEFLGRRPTFFLRSFNRDELLSTLGQRYYDLAWISPVGCMGLLDYCALVGLRLAKHVAIGLNDMTTTGYVDAFRHLLSGRVGWYLPFFQYGLRVPLLRMHERKYLLEVDMVHVQTPMEELRAKRLLKDRQCMPMIVVAQNGRKSELEQASYKGVDSNTVLYMTHLDGPRSYEPKWFLTKVWPLVQQKNPKITLQLAGTPPRNGNRSAARFPAGVKILGYVDDLVGLYDSVSLAVIPTLHGTGLINRALDALTAGVPVIATPQVLSTVAGLQPGTHALACASAQEFVQAILELLTNTERRLALSRAGRWLAQRQPSWKETTDHIMTSVDLLCKSPAQHA